MAVAGAPLYVAPHWVLRDGAGGLHIQDLYHGDTLQIAGELREAVLSGSAAGSPIFKTLARTHPALARLERALSAGAQVQRFDRAAALRGPGFGLLFVELTARCNEACVHCYAESSPERTEALSLAQVLAVVEDAHRLGFRTVQFTGGDPLISPSLLPGVERARDLALDVEVYTNGLALQGALYERLRALKVAFAFSFYSSDPEVHDAITRTPGSQRRTLRAIDQVIADGVPFRIGVIGMDQNRAGLKETLAFLVDRGVAKASIGVSYQREVGRGSLTDASSEEEWTAGEDTHGRREEESFAGKAAVASDGTVYPCIFGRSLPLGSLSERSLFEILSDPLPLDDLGDGLSVQAEDGKDRLSCWECRLREVLLGGGRGAERESFALHLSRVRVEVTCDPVLARGLRAGLGLCTTPIVAAQRTARLVQDAAGDVFLDGALVSDARAPEFALPQVEGALYTAVADWHSDVALLHAAALVRDGRALLLVGPSGHGKSSLAREAVRAGWSYLSDDLTFFDGHAVWGLPRTIQFDSVPLAELSADGFLEGCDLDSYRFWAGDGSVLVLPMWPVPKSQLAAGTIPIEQTELVFLSRGDRTSLTALSPAHALARLHAARIGRSAIAPALGPLADRGGHELMWNDLREAMTILGRVT